MADHSDNFAPKPSRGADPKTVLDAELCGALEQTAQQLRVAGAWLGVIGNAGNDQIKIDWRSDSAESIDQLVDEALKGLQWSSVVVRERLFTSRQSGALRVVVMPPLEKSSGAHPVLVAPLQDGTAGVHQERDMLGLAGLIHARLVESLRNAALSSEVESLSMQLGNSYEEVSLIYHLSSGMTINQQPRRYLQELCGQVMQVANVRGMGVMLQLGAPGDDSFEISGDVQLPGHIVARLGLDLTRWLRDKQSALVINQTLSTEFSYLSPYVTRLLAVPVMRQDLLLGALVSFDKIGDEFSTADSKLLSSIANQTGVFLENAGLFSDLNSLIMGLLHSLTSAVDAKDAYTCGHSQRVALLGRQIAVQAQLPASFCERVYMAGLLHDVGKIGVPETVLQKPGKLTAEEFEQMKDHVEIGAKILRDVKQVEDLVPGVRHHHERFDGRGYPDRLAGVEIPLLARLLCLADCFDAMTSNRTYRKALPIEVARMEIQRCSGTQFDPELADAFLAISVEIIRDTITSVGELPSPEPKPAADQALSDKTSIILPLLAA